MGLPAEEKKKLYAQYRNLLLDGIAPFWLERGIDREHGGVLSCMSDDGQVLSGDKFIWSQARSVWTFSALYNRIEPRPEFLEAARNSVRFLLAHGRDDRGRWVYHTDREGRVLEGATSIYADCFAIYGLSEYYRATRDELAIAVARQTSLRECVPASRRRSAFPREQVNNLSLASLIPALKIIAHAEVPNGTLNVALLDLTTQRVTFHQDAVHDLDWAKLSPALKQTGSNVIDIHALENRRENAQFFLAEVRRRIGASARNEGPAQPFPILIVLSGPMEFAHGQDLHPIELGDKPQAEVFYIRYHSIPPPALANRFPDESRRGRRTPLSAPGRAPLALTEPVDSLERTLKPLQPHLYDVYNPEQFRKALSSLVDEISRL